MSESVKIAITLPRHLLDAAERARADRGETRSEFFQHAVEAVLQEPEAVERYIRGYRECPETAEEIVAAQQSSAAILAQEPWE